MRKTALAAVLAALSACASDIPGPAPWEGGGILFSIQGVYAVQPALQVCPEGLCLVEVADAN